MTDTAPALRYDDDELLKIVGEERKRSIGFGDGDSGELTSARETALAFYKGDMLNVPAEHQVVSRPGRSKAVDTTVADAIETVLPDVLEIFVGGDDVATFIPQGQQDEEAAQEETDFVNHVVFTENEGFLTLYTAIKDALLTRTGIIHWWWEEEEKTETRAEVAAEMVGQVQKVAQVAGQELEPGEATEEGMVPLNATSLHGKVCIRAFPSEDFSCAADTVSLRDATYCVVRDRPRIQDLIARGIDPEKARALKSYTLRNGTVEMAREEAGESQNTRDNATDDLRVVEVRAHFIRLGGEDGKLQVWRVVTDSEETVLLEKEPVHQIPFAALTPYIIPHRFYGESVADKLIEVQKIKTALLRMLLDSGYFALNQRMEVAMSKANEFTIPDLLRNEPNVPVRTAQEGAVRPLSAGALNFDAMAALEYASTVAEGRSGIVRNAQGLNPDTLHDTAKGAMVLITAAQKRVRLIARIFAETGVKDLFLGVHDLLRCACTHDHAPMSAKLRNNWKTVQPSDWSERSAMAIHVGVGSAGKEHDLMVSTQRLELMERLVMVAGDTGIVGGPQIHNALTAWEKAAGSKAPDLYWADPSDPSTPKPEPKPDPEMAKAQSQAQLAQAKAASDTQLAQVKAQTDAQLQAMKHQNDLEAATAQAQQEHELNMARLEGEMNLKRYQIDQELQLKREQLAAELELKRELGFAQANVTHQVGMAKVSASTSQVEPGGEPG